MASELILPAPAMEAVLSFLDARDLATMAQTCRTWQRIVYRKSVWVEKNISYCIDLTLIHTSVPPHARHIGSPTETCFLYWLQDKRARLIFENPFPISIEQITDPAKYIKVAHTYWKRHGRPCALVDHHRLQDLLRFSLPREFTKSEKQRILHRLIAPTESTPHNVYCHYLERLNHEISKPLVLSPISFEPDPTNPLHRYKVAADKFLRARFDAVNSAVAARCTKNQASFTALARHGHAEFELNDTWFRKERNGVWSAAGFSYKKSTA